MRFLIIFFFIITVSCKYSNSKTISGQENLEKLQEKYTNLQILFYPIDVIEDLRYSFIVKNDSITFINHIDSNLQITTKSKKINNSQLDKINSNLNKIIYFPPTNNEVTDTWEVKIISKGETIFHKRSFGRGQENGKEVDELIDYILKITNFKIHVYGFTCPDEL